jgi:GWxTD domain-containing protein
VSVRRVARFFVALLAVGPAVHAQADPPHVRDRIQSATEMQLDSLYAPLVYLMHEDEQGTYPSLSVEEKRNFLRRFWARRDPKPKTFKNEAEAQFNAWLGTVNRTFAERGTTEVPGWRTDRGRIYLEYGPPDITLSRRGMGTTLPFSVWKYTQGTDRPRKYCFVDITGFGNYVLVYSNDPREPSRSDWRQLLGDDGYADALDF